MISNLFLTIKKTIKAKTPKMSDREADTAILAASAVAGIDVQKATSLKEVKKLGEFLDFTLAEFAKIQPVYADSQLLVRMNNSIKAAGITPFQLGQASVGTTFIGNLLDRKIQRFNWDKLESICNVLGADPYYIAFGEYEPKDGPLTVIPDNAAAVLTAASEDAIAIPAAPPEASVKEAPEPKFAEEIDGLVKKIEALCKTRRMTVKTFCSKGYGVSHSLYYSIRRHEHDDEKGVAKLQKAYNAFLHDADEAATELSQEQSVLNEWFHDEVDHQPQFMQRLRKAMLSKGVTPKTLASMTRIDQKDIDRIMNADGVPSAKMVRTIASALDVEYDYLVFNRTSGNSRPNVEHKAEKPTETPSSASAPAFTPASATASVFDAAAINIPSFAKNEALKVLLYGRTGVPDHFLSEVRLFARTIKPMGDTANASLQNGAALLLAAELFDGPASEEMVAECQKFAMRQLVAAAIKHSGAEIRVAANGDIEIKGVVNIFEAKFA